MAIREYVTPEDAIRVLREALALDESALRRLLTERTPCSKALADHPTIQVGSEEIPFADATGTVYSVSVLGLLNGIFGADEDGWGIIAIRVETEGDDAGKIVGVEASPAKRRAELNPSRFEADARAALCSGCRDGMSLSDTSNSGKRFGMPKHWDADVSRWVVCGAQPAYRATNLAEHMAAVCDRELRLRATIAEPEVVAQVKRLAPKPNDVVVVELPAGSELPVATVDALSELFSTYRASTVVLYEGGRVAGVVRAEACPDCVARVRCNSSAPIGCDRCGGTGGVLEAVDGAVERAP